MMAAEALGIDYEQVRPIVADTSSLGYTFLTGGSRAHLLDRHRGRSRRRSEVIKETVRARRQDLGDRRPTRSTWEDGMAEPAGANAGEFEPLSFADLARMAGKTGGPIAGHAHLNAPGRGPELRRPIWSTSRSTRRPGEVTILRYTVDPGRRQGDPPEPTSRASIQGGAVQGIGWALNEEYIYGPDGKMQNAGFLDYRMPVASDVPMIDTVIVEVPNPRHPLRRARRRRDADRAADGGDRERGRATPPASASPSCRCRRPRC